MRHRSLLAWCLLTAVMSAAAEEVSLEYQVKATYLFNFTRFVEWPESALPAGSPFTICVAGTNPFGSVLADTIRNESVMGRPLATRVVQDNTDGCQILFIPRGVQATPYLRRLRGSPVLTVGESRGFLTPGGAINFVLDGGKVRFEIHQEAAEQAKLRISSRLLRLAVGSPMSGGGA